MDIYGIDVSSYQGNIDWKKVKASGVKFAILKVIRKDLNPDKQFENNWKGCINNDVEIQGVYNYSYATTVAKAISDANMVLKILNGRKTMVWLDVEDACQKGLGLLLIDIINAYAAVIKSAGLKFGVYTGASFYNTYIKKYGDVPYAKWIAAYGTNTGKPQENKRPATVPLCIGWQYSSKATIPGIIGDVDVNLFFGGTEADKKPLTAIPTLRKNDRGTQVLILQQDLNYLGILGENSKSLTEDGIFGKNSVYAVKEFQKMVFPNKPKEWDGVYGPKSEAMMYSKIN